MPEELYYFSGRWDASQVTVLIAYLPFQRQQPALHAVFKLRVIFGPHCKVGEVGDTVKPEPPLHKTERTPTFYEKGKS